MTTGEIFKGKHMNKTTDKQIEALKLALEALKLNCSSQTESPATKAIAAIDEALADHTEQPLEMVAEQPAQQWNAGVPPLYPEPEPGVSFKVAYEQPAQQQEPVITKNEKGLTLHVGWDDLPAGTKLYTSPPASKPLTDEEIKLVMDGRGEEGDDDYVKPAFDPFGISEDDLINFARAIEAAHGIKENT